MSTTILNSLMMREIGIERDEFDVDLLTAPLQAIFDAGVEKAVREGYEFVPSYGVVGLAPT